MFNRITGSTRTFLLASALFISTAPTAFAADGLSVQRLTWAGVKISSDRATVLIDAVGTDLWGGDAPGGLVPVESDTPRTYALVTHTHNDHFDEATLKEVLGDKGYVICHRSIATHIASRGLKVIPADEFVPVSRGGFSFTAVPAADGFDSHQVSWIVSHGEQRFLHGGDTLWHGRWRSIGEQFGKFDAVFLPVNAPIVAGDPASEVPAVMGPAQAVDAAILLGAKRLVPIHYGLSGDEGYKEVRNPIEQVKEHAARRGLAVAVLQPGDKLD